MRRYLVHALYSNNPTAALNPLDVMETDSAASLWHLLPDTIRSGRGKDYPPPPLCAPHTAHPDRQAWGSARSSPIPTGAAAPCGMIGAHCGCSIPESPSATNAPSSWTIN